MTRGVVRPSGLFGLSLLVLEAAYAAENEREEWHHVYDQLQPYLIQKGVRADVLLANGGLRRIPSDAAPIDVSPVLDDAVFAEMVASRIAQFHDVLDEIETVRASIDDIVRLINASCDWAGPRPGAQVAESPHRGSRGSWPSWPGPLKLPEASR